MLPGKPHHLISRRFVLSALLLLMACGTSSVYLTVTRPAEINLKGFSKIAIGDILNEEGQAGAHASDIADGITAALFASGAYEVLDRNHLGALLSEHALGEAGLIDESTAAQIGQFIGSAALIFGRIQTDNYKEELTKEKAYTDKEGKSHQTHVRRGVYRLSVNMKVIDVQTARILAIKNIPAVRRATKRADKKDPAKIDTESLLAGCIADITRQFIRMIAPFEEQVRAAFLTDKLLPETDRAVGLFRVGEWDDGIAILEQATKKSGLPSEIQAKTYYNLGLAKIYVGEFDAAVEQLKTALSLDPTSRRIQQTILRAKEEKANAEKLREQMGKSEA